MYFALYCVNHDAYGPELRRGAGGTGMWRRLQAGDENWAEEELRELPGLTKNGADAAWGAFLADHEDCELQLHNERIYLPELVQRRLPQ